mgnify:CR=1 FL=1
MRHSPWLLRLMLTCGGCLALLSGSVVLAQAPTLDRVEIRDRKDGSTRTLTGKLMLTKNGLQLVSSDKKATLLNFEEILRIEPGDLPDVDRISFKAAFNNEDKKTKKDYDAARTTYADLLKKAKDPAARRHLEYRLALIATRVADLEADSPRWKELAEAALKEWDSFLTTHTSGWEVWLAARTASRLQVELGQYDAAARLWSSISKLSDLPADLRLEAAIQQVDALFRSKNYAAAASALSAALKDAKLGSARNRLELYDLAIQEYQTLLKQAPDNLQAMLQLAASTPGFSTCNECAYHRLEADVLVEPLEYVDGMLTVPQGPGLGVEIDRAKIEQYEVRGESGEVKRERGEGRA